MNPPELKYTKEHVWVKIEGDIATVGITDFAQQQLKDVVFVELPEIGRKVKQSEALGSAESVKSVSDIIAPLSGEVVEVNDKLSDSPELLNKDPYGNGWIAKISLDNPEEAGTLMSAEDYDGFTKEKEQKKKNEN